MTGAELEHLVDLALAMEREQMKLMGRELYAAEFEWLVMAGFRHKFGAEQGGQLARIILDAIQLVREEYA